MKGLNGKYLLVSKTRAHIRNRRSMNHNWLIDSYMLVILIFKILIFRGKCPCHHSNWWHSVDICLREWTHWCGRCIVASWSQLGMSWILIGPQIYCWWYFSVSVKGEIWEIGFFLKNNFRNMFTFWFSYHLLLMSLYIFVFNLLFRSMSLKVGEHLWWRQQEQDISVQCSSLSVKVSQCFDWTI